MTEERKSKSKQPKRKMARYEIVKRKYHIPKNFIKMLLALWRGEKEEWGGGFDLEPHLDHPQRVALVHGDPEGVDVDEVDFEVYMHFHPDYRTHPKPMQKYQRILDEYFSIDDFWSTLKDIHDANPILRTRKHSYHILVTGRGNLKLMRVPIKKAMKRLETLIKEEQKGTSLDDEEALYEAFKKSVKYLDMKGVDNACEIFGRGVYFKKRDVSKRLPLYQIFKKCIKERENDENREKFFGAYSTVPYGYFEREFGITVTDFEPPYEIDLEIPVRVD
jgi:hypothetical protein